MTRWSPKEVCAILLDEWHIRCSPDKDRIRIPITEARKLVTILREMREHPLMAVTDGEAIGAGGSGAGGGGPQPPTGEIARMFLPPSDAISELERTKAELFEVKATRDQAITEARHQMILEFEQKKRALRKANAAASRTALVAKIAEHMTPLLRGFKYSPKDARHVGELVDYIVYDGLEAGYIRDVVFLEVKTKRGGARVTNPREKLLREAIDAGRVRYEVFIPDVSEAKK